jgi:uncharacterized protein YndB with AHSA1/START domain
MTDDQIEAASATTVLSTPSDREISSVRIFDAPRERVFAAYTDAELIPEWWGPRRMTTIVEEMDVRPGGALFGARARRAGNRFPGNLSRGHPA